jgi:hypothetical protein
MTSEMNELRKYTADALVEELVRRHIATKTPLGFLPLKWLQDARETHAAQRELIDKLQESERCSTRALDVNKELLEALKPFAERAAAFDPEYWDDDEAWFTSRGIKIGDLRRARDALAAAEKGV